MVNFETWYYSIPVITRTYLTLSTLTSFAVTFDLLSDLQLYLNFSLVFKNFQVWRLLTNFLFFDKFSINFVLHLYFLYFYCRRLEEHSFHRKSADFLYLMLFGSVIMLFIAPLLRLYFLSHSLVIMLVYVWSRRNPHEQLRLYGLFTVGAGYISYILLGLQWMMGGSPIVDLMGIFVGHCYVFLKDVLPAEYENINILKTPHIFTYLFPSEHQENQPENVEEEIQDLIAQDEQHAPDDMIAPPPEQDIVQQEPVIEQVQAEEVVVEEQQQPADYSTLSREQLAELRRRRFEQQR
jgi:Derlin-2/3